MHSGTEAHGMLSYLMRCAYTKTPYRIYGYDGLQVRDQLHAIDLITGIHRVMEAPKATVVYNIGGGRGNSCSTVEAIQACEELTGNKMEISFHPMRTGDHRLWITDNSRFEGDYPDWEITTSLRQILDDILREGKTRW
jgi:CDP-paratose 2-epimerase